MATALGTSLPPLLFERLSANRASAPADVAIALTSVDPRGYPHPALLTYDAVVADGQDRLHVAVHGSSRTADNLARGRRATLSFVDAAGAWYVKAEVIGAGGPHPRRPGVVLIPLRIVQVLGDAVDRAREPDAAIVTGITFRRAVQDTTP
jgi:hypothetical protein